MEGTFPSISHWESLMMFLKELRFDWLAMLNFYERPFRAKLIPAKVWEDLDRYKNDSAGLVNYVKKWKTRIEWHNPKTKTFKQYIAVGGEYDVDMRQCIVQIHTVDYDKFVFTAVAWNRFKFKLIQVIMHELIHFMQYDRRGDEWSNYVVPYKKLGNAIKDEERRYLSEFDEIQAYAHCVYLDYKMYRPNISISDLISRSKEYKDSRTLHYILKTFDYDYRNNHAIPKIIHQINKWERKYDKHMRANCRPK